MTDWKKIHNSIDGADIVVKIGCIRDSLLNCHYQAVVYRKDYCRPKTIQMLDNPTSYYKNTSCMEMILDSFSIWFVQSLSKDLEGISRIYCIPMGDLLAIPFEYGKITDCSMLCEKYEFYRITSEFELCNKSCQISRKVLVCGDVDFRMPISGDVEFQNGFVFRSSKIGKLKYSELSTDSIEQYIKGKTIIILSRQDANEMAFKKLVQDSIDILLIETHGLFLSNYNLVRCEGNNNPMENHALALAGASYALEGGVVPDSIDDGILTAKEISELDMHNVDLAVVSACKSALGEIREDGVYGLMRGFKQAGVRSLIMATDDIVDYVSGQLWIQLFRNLAKGMTKRKALLEGLKYIRTMDNGAFSHPKYWTPYILIDGVE